ncbi:hypothetical protein Clacol_006667 [Clathrus columnatus]|uniref:Zn(2)-C6 fungal-type domain-containing protein n=1 Tax=Clathrus columnatus TaxID=1419009 RepID=A0AAV5AHR6_9AGAM|nr:hypothetical protein Clacol_006667 [Clathrus columnatus]
MENFRFILENPHPDANNTKQRKRARLVTACDSCRIKKIKCQQTSPNGRCEACKTAKTPCLFGDRDRYQAERGVSCAWSPPMQDIDMQALPPASSSSSSSSPNLSIRKGKSLAYSPYAIQISAPTSRSGTPSSSFSSAYSQQFQSDSSIESSGGGTSSKKLLPFAHQFLQHPSSFDNNFTSFHDDIPLFDHQRSRFPHPQRMHYLATLFFDTVGHSFPFLDRVDVLHRIEQKTCSAILANCLASLALRFSNNPENLSAASSFYDMAKNLAANAISVPSIEALHALICLSWTEYGAGQMDTFWIFSRMVITMCLDLGLGHEATIQVATTPEVRTRLRLTWWTVVCIADIAASWATGRSTTIDLSKYDTKFPQGNDERTVLFRTVTQLYLLRNKVSRIIESYIGNRSTSSLEWALSESQLELDRINESLPYSLTFGVENLARAKECNYATIFIQTHFLIYATNILINRPSLLTPYDLPMTVNSNTHMESAQSSVKSFLEILMIIHDVLPTPLQEPFMDLPLLVAIRFLMKDIQNFQLNSSNASTKPWQLVLFDICKDNLMSVASHCGNNGSFETLLKQKSGIFLQPETSLLTDTQLATDLFTAPNSNMDWIFRPPLTDDNSSDTSSSFRSSSRELSPFITPNPTPSREPVRFVHSIPPLVQSLEGEVTTPNKLNYGFPALTETPVYQYNDYSNSPPFFSVNNSRSSFTISLDPQRNLQKLGDQFPPPWPLTS